MWLLLDNIIIFNKPNKIHPAQTPKLKTQSRATASDTCRYTKVDQQDQARGE